MTGYQDGAAKPRYQDTAAQRRRKLAVVKQHRTIKLRPKRVEPAEVYNAPERRRRIRRVLDMYCRSAKVHASSHSNTAALLTEPCELTGQKSTAGALRAAGDAVDRGRRKRGGGGESKAEVYKPRFGERSTGIKTVVVNPVGNGKRR